MSLCKILNIDDNFHMDRTYNTQCTLHIFYKISFKMVACCWLRKLGFDTKPVSYEDLFIFGNPYSLESNDITVKILKLQLHIENEKFVIQIT